MQVIGGKEHPAPLLEPGVDFLQERGIDQAAGERVIDTHHDFVPGPYTRLNGRKYVGENTVREMARLIGLVDADEANAIQRDFDAYKADVAQALVNLHGFSEELTKLLQSAPAPVRPSSQTPPDAAEHAKAAQARHEAEVAGIEAAQKAGASDKKPQPQRKPQQTKPAQKA